MHTHSHTHTLPFLRALSLSSRQESERVRGYSEFSSSESDSAAFYGHRDLRAFSADTAIRHRRGDSHRHGDSHRRGDDDSERDNAIGREKQRHVHTRDRAQRADSARGDTHTHTQTNTHTIERDVATDSEHMAYGGKGGMERELARYGTSMWKDRRDEIKSWEPSVGVVSGWKAGGEGGGGGWGEGGGGGGGGGGRD